MTPISWEKWEQMSPKMKWDILAALRGPDQRFSMIKWFTTSVIRHVMETVLIKLIGKPAGGMINKNLGIVILPSPHRTYREKGVGLEYKEVEDPCPWCPTDMPMENCTCMGTGVIRNIRGVRAEAQYTPVAWFDLNHFADHVQEAAAFLGIPVIYIDYPVWEKAMENDYLGSAIKVLMDGCDEPEVKEILRKHAKANGVAQ